MRKIAKKTTTQDHLLPLSDQEMPKNGYIRVQEIKTQLTKKILTEAVLTLIKICSPVEYSNSFHFLPIFSYENISKTFQDFHDLHSRIVTFWVFCDW